MDDVQDYELDPEEVQHASTEKHPDENEGAPVADLNGDGLADDLPPLDLSDDLDIEDKS